jgi:hypothetical protein
MVFDNETVYFGFSDAYTLTVARNNFDAQIEQTNKQTPQSRFAISSLSRYFL